MSWYKNNQAIFENRRIKFLYEEDGLCSLVVRDITTQDRGKYKCVASNKKGKIQCSCELFVEGKFGVKILACFNFHVLTKPVFDMYFDF